MHLQCNEGSEARLKRFGFELSQNYNLPGLKALVKRLNDVSDSDSDEGSDADTSPKRLRNSPLLPASTIQRSSFYPNGSLPNHWNTKKKQLESVPRHAS
jgi:hypothetical protein